MTLENLIGTVVDTVAFTVEEGKILELARATGATDPAHRAGLATATHVVVAAHHRDQAGFTTALGLELERVVVGSVSWEYGEPLRVGDRVTGSRTVVADETRAGRSGTSRRLTLRTRYVDEVGRERVVVTEQLIERAAR